MISIFILQQQQKSERDTVFFIFYCKTQNTNENKQKIRTGRQSRREPRENLSNKLREQNKQKKNHLAALW